MKFYEHPAYIGHASESGERVKEFEEQFNKQEFDDSVTWSLDHSIAKFILPRLERYYQLADTNINIDFTPGFRQAIEDMIEGFKLQSDDDSEESEGNARKIKKAWTLLGEWHHKLWW